MSTPAPPHLGLLGERGVRPLPDDLTMLGLLAAGRAGRDAGGRRGR